MTKPAKTHIERSIIVPIVADGAIAGPIADGRLIPVLILDTAGRPEMAEAIRVHKHLTPGDAKTRWAVSRENKDHVALLLTLVRPVEAELALLFSIENEGILVENILTGGGVYLQSGTIGDRVSTTMDAARVLVEVPDTGFRHHWDNLLRERMAAVVARRLGVSRRSARPIAERMISAMREFTEFRMPR